MNKIMHTGLMILTTIIFYNISISQTQIKSTFWEMKLDNWIFMNQFMNDTILFKIESIDEVSVVDDLPISNLWHLADSFGANLYIMDQHQEEICGNSLFTIERSDWLIDTLYSSDDILVLNIEYDTIRKLKCEVYLSLIPQRKIVSSIKIFLLNYQNSNVPLFYLSRFKNVISQIKPVSKN